MDICVSFDFRGGDASCDVALVGGVVGACMATALLVCCIPAWRAMRLDPVIALRAD